MHARDCRGLSKNTLRWHLTWWYPQSSRSLTWPRNENRATPKYSVEHIRQWLIGISSERSCNSGSQGGSLGMEPPWGRHIQTSLVLRALWRESEQVSREGDRGSAMPSLRHWPSCCQRTRPWPLSPSSQRRGQGVPGPRGWVCREQCSSCLRPLCCLCRAPECPGLNHEYCGLPTQTPCGLGPSWGKAEEGKETERDPVYLRRLGVSSEG